MQFNSLLLGVITAGALLAPAISAAQDSGAVSTGASLAEAIPQSDEPLDTIPVSPAREPQAPAPSSPAVRNRIVEEVVVTAQKREEKLQDVPISIQAFSGEAIAARGVENTYQLGQVVPSLQFTDVAGFTLIFLRGIGTDNFIPSADPSIATYIDGIYVPQGHTEAQSLGNVQRVEVLKGPQGTLFGRNATGGAISVITEDPGNIFKAQIESELGNFNSRQVKGSVTLPVVDWLSVSGAGVYKTQDNYYDATNFDLPKTKSYAYRFKASIHPADERRSTSPPTTPSRRATAAPSATTPTRRWSALRRASCQPRTTSTPTPI